MVRERNDKDVFLFYLLFGLLQSGTNTKLVAESHWREEYKIVHEGSFLQLSLATVLTYLQN